MESSTGNIILRWKQYGTRIALKEGEETVSFAQLAAFLEGDNWEPEASTLLRIKSYLEALITGAIYSPSGEQVEIPPTHIQYLQGNAGLLLSTTGTKGQPRWVLLHAASLLQKYSRLKSAHKAVLAFSTAHISGWESIWSVLMPGGTLIIPVGTGLAHWKELLDQDQPELLSCTPSWFYFKLQALGTSAFKSLKYVNLGGEPCSGALWEYFETTCPHILFRPAFGTTETSNVQTIAANNGFFFPGKIPGEDYKVEHDFLLIRKPAPHPGPLDMDPAVVWISTGDRVEVNAAGAIRILERLREEEAMVGGQRISLSALQQAIEQSGLVLRCLLGIEKNELLGEILQASVILAPGVQLATLRNVVSEIQLRKSIPIRWKLLEVQQLNQRLKLPL